MNSSTVMTEQQIVAWQEIDLVLLDMDGTLLDLYFDNFFWQQHLPGAYAQKFGLARAEAEQQLFTCFRTVQGTLDWYCLDYWQNRLGLDMVALKQEVRHLIAVRPGVWEFLRFLREGGKRLVLVTNAHRKSLELKMTVTGMAPWLDRLVSTHDFGYPKEEQVFWRALFAEEGCSPARTLFIDDTPRILDAARQFGIRHLWSIYEPDSRAQPSPPSAYPQVRAFYPFCLAAASGETGY